MWIKALFRWLLPLNLGHVLFPIPPTATEVLEKKIEKLEAQIKDVQDLSLNTVDIVPGKGWEKTIENAVMNIDNRLDTLSLVLQQHQKNFNVLANEREKLEEIATQPKDQLN